MADEFLAERGEARAGRLARALLVLRGLRGRTPISLAWMRRTQRSVRGRATSTGAGAPCARFARRRRCVTRSPRTSASRPATLRRRSRRGRCTRACGASCRQEVAAGRLTLSAEDATPLGLADRATCCTSSACRCVLLLASPLLLVARAVAAASGCAGWSRPIPSSARARIRPTSAELARLEDHDVTNQFSAMGSRQAGPRSALARRRFVLLGHRLRGPPRLHARPPRARAQRSISRAGCSSTTGSASLFFSNYDGSLESYMDDFINKVGFGLNVVFSNGIGYPRDRLAAAGRVRGRAEVQGLPAPPPDADAGLVQGLSRA